MLVARKGIDVTELIYKRDESGYRFALGELGERNLICVGLNPSRAEPGDYDPTMKRVENWAIMHGYDGHIMVNLYPQRATKPSRMDDSAHLNKSMVHKNLECISRLFEVADFDVWAAWGANVGKRRNSHLLDSLSQIWRAFEKRGGDFDAKWFRLGDLTSAGHPRHPLRVAYSEDPVEFDVDLYLKRLGY